MRIPFTVFLVLLLSGCSPVPMIALSDDGWKPLSEMPVKGRNGFFIRQKLSFGGSVGFEFRNPEGKILAAVSMIGNGTFYMGACSEEEKFLLANAAAALLLQQLLDEGVS
jgi:hypothetical protein